MLRLFRTALLLSIASLLAACGSYKGSGDCSPVRVQVFGNSVGRGLGEELQRVADEQRGKGKVLIENRSVGATTSVDLINGTDKKNKRWPDHVGGDVIFVNHGISDENHKVPLETYVHNLRTFAASGAIILVQTPRPWDKQPDEYVEAAKQIPGSIDTNHFVRSFPDWKAHVPDATHPDKEMLRKIAENLLMPQLPECGRLR